MNYKKQSDKKQFHEIVLNWIRNYTNDDYGYCGMKRFNYGGTHFKTDGAWSRDGKGKDGKNYIVLEAEGSSGTSAISNIAKYYALLQSGRSLKITLVQVLDKKFQTDRKYYVSNIQACRFFATAMKNEFGERFCFHSIPDNLEKMSDEETKNDVRTLFAKLLK